MTNGNSIGISLGKSVGNKKIIIIDASVPSVIIYFYYRRTKNYRWKIHRQSIFVGDFVGKLITDEICILRRWKNSVGKTVKCCSVLASFFFNILK
jgi:hypothetical protein